jgi:hypothetical protein
MTVHNQKVTSIKEFKIKKLLDELDALEKNIIDGMAFPPMLLLSIDFLCRLEFIITFRVGFIRFLYLLTLLALKIKSISIGIVSRQNTFQDSVETLLKNRTISPAFEAFVTALAGPFEPSEHSNHNTNKSNEPQQQPLQKTPSESSQQQQQQQQKTSTNSNSTSPLSLSLDKLATNQLQQRKSESTPELMSRQPDSPGRRVIISPRGALSAMSVPTISAPSKGSNTTSSKERSKERSKEKSSDTNQEVCLLLLVSFSSFSWVFVLIIVFIISLFRFLFLYLFLFIIFRFDLFIYMFGISLFIFSSFDAISSSHAVVQQ